MFIVVDIIVVVIVGVIVVDVIVDMIVDVTSSRRSMRSATPGKSKPYAACSSASQAAPSPRIALPPEITSSVVTVFAR